MLDVPDVMTLYLIITVGYLDVSPKEGVRRPLKVGIAHAQLFFRIGARDFTF